MEQEQKRETLKKKIKQSLLKVTRNIWVKVCQKERDQEKQTDIQMKWILWTKVRKMLEEHALKFKPPPLTDDFEREVEQLTDQIKAKVPKKRTFWNLNPKTMDRELELKELKTKIEQMHKIKYSHQSASEFLVWNLKEQDL